VTYAIALVKGKPKEREKTQLLFQTLSKDKDFKKKTGVEIQQVFMSFGWPDFVLLLKGSNVELLKRAIVTIRDEAGKGGDEIETSTLICTTQEEINKKSEEWARESLG
jgi:uncharacterized protein with GYD domain